MDCIFCHGIKEEQVLLETGNYIVVFDIDPIQSGHLLIISKRHFEHIREVSKELLIELLDLKKKIIDLLEKSFGITGISIIQNNGAIMDEGTHFHVHLIPRYSDDLFWENQAVIEHPISTTDLSNKLKLLK
ncbi:HIT family protein [Solibacillus silvestris]|uniref:HIT family protein n=1 Tax=Solibacillus silvestris TaxID=76853 RepID=UPI003F7FD47C